MKRIPLVLLFFVLCLSGCKKGIFDAGGQRGFLKNDFRDAVNVSSVSLSMNAFSSLSEAGVLKIPEGYKKTVTYTKTDGKLKILEVSTIEPITGLVNKTDSIWGYIGLILAPFMFLLGLWIGKKYFTSIIFH